VENCSFEWAGGLFEGEGCIYIADGPIAKKKSVRLSLATADFDVLDKFHKIVGVGSVTPFKGTAKPMKVWRAGKQEDVEWVLDVLIPYFGSRRASKAMDAIAFIAQKRKDLKESYKQRGLERRKPCGHPRPVENCCQR
jgi:hypothetical protein